MRASNALLSVVVAVLLTAGCGGGGGGGDSGSQNAVPLANAGATQSVVSGSLVTLNGSTSSDADGDSLTYSWTLTSKPTGSAATLTGANSVTPKFTADVAGAYVATLVVNDGQVDSAPVSVTVTASVGNAAPVANAGTGQNVVVGAVVTLNGSASSDANGDMLTYSWTLTSRPAGSTATLSGATSAKPTFVANAEGTYVASLVVNDGKVNSSPATVTVIASVANAAPVANAGTAQNVFVGTSVTLDGSASSDANGDPLTYAWDLTSRPTGSSALLSGVASVAPSFPADVAGTYVATLVVNDGKGWSAPSTVTVTATLPSPKSIGVPYLARNNMTVTLISFTTTDLGNGYNRYTATYKQENNTAVAIDEGFLKLYFSNDVPVPQYGFFGTVLPGAAFAITRSYSFDVLKTSVAWLLEYDADNFFAAQPIPGALQWLLETPAPVANAGADQDVLVGTTVTLDGSASSDANDDPLTYSWTLTSKPAGSTATLSGATSAKSTFVADLEGTYVASLVVSDGKVNSSPATVTVSAGSALPAISAGNVYSLALRRDGTVWAWGSNEGGQLGINSASTIAAVPAPVVGPGGGGVLTGMTAIAAGRGGLQTVFSLALRRDGTVWAWGYNYYGQLGNNSTTDSGAPVQVVGPGGVGVLTGVTAIAVGWAHALALKSDGTVWAWGLNLLGQLGNNSTTDSGAPVQVVGPGGVGVLTGVTAIAAGANYSMALKSDGTVWAWGDNHDGQLGINSASAIAAVPAPVVGPGGVGVLTGVTAIAAGPLLMALKSDGTVWWWGNVSVSPVQVVGPGGGGVLTGVTAIATGGGHHALFLKSDGTVWAEGENSDGQLGNNSNFHAAAPVQVVGPGGGGVLTGVTAIAAGYAHSLALQRNGTFLAWGGNMFGQLGNNSTTNSAFPVQVGF